MFYGQKIHKKYTNVLRFLLYLFVLCVICLYITKRIFLKKFLDNSRKNGIFYTMQNEIASALFKNVRPEFSKYDIVTDTVILFYRHVDQYIEDYNFLDLWSDELKIVTKYRKDFIPNFPYRIEVSEL